MKTAFTALALIVFCVGSIYAADPCPKACGEGALALAQAQRERETASATSRPCHDDYAVALAEALDTHKPLVIWVGMVCDDAKEVCRAIRGEVVSCHQKTFNGDATPRLLVTGSPMEAGWYSFAKSDLDSGKLKSADVRAKYTKPAAVQPVSVQPAVPISRGWVIPAAIFGGSNCPNGQCPNAR